ncbi:hypothetical protein NQ317_019908 [Molorchus minor]|uniref:Uncharacterized protein n=1 Tax=Molorchus minor TaxID=1323400 RepID=A0ABQ9K4J9_9CUCU|nr:hypothetical protein NQ317_019908 [Molorchus minor]
MGYTFVAEPLLHYTPSCPGRYKCTESIYVLHIPVLYTEHFVKRVRWAYIDRSYVLNNCHHFPQIAKRVTAYPLQQFFQAGRCVAAGHAVGSEAATGATKPPAGSKTDAICNLVDEIGVVVLKDRIKYANFAAYMIVDEMHEEHPELLKDQYWDDVVPKDLPYTVASEHYRKEGQRVRQNHAK